MYWLVIIFFTPQNNYAGKQEFQVPTMAHCRAMERQAHDKARKGKKIIDAWCMTDDHHAGRRHDPWMPYD